MAQARSVFDVPARKRSRQDYEMDTRDPSRNKLHRSEPARDPRHQRNNIADSTGRSGRVDETRPARPAAPRKDSEASLDDNSLSLEVPGWYEKLKFSGRPNRGAQVSRTDVELGVLQNRIDKCKKALAISPDAFVKECHLALPEIHKAMFLDVDATMVRNHFLLHLQAGIPVLCRDTAPWYVANDAAELFRKWARKIFTSDMLHGLEPPEYNRIVKHYPGKRNADVVGNNDLVVGHWVPKQLCLVRDGIHGAAIAGIYSGKGNGAYSLVMASGLSDSDQTRPSTYENIDLGDTVLYCGTDGEAGKPSENTQSLLDNITTKQPVRFIRSHNAPKPYAPIVGYRYDGLYDITDSECLDEDIQRHRFKLVRRPGQVPLRYQGPGVRPTKEEIRQVEKGKREKKYITD